MPAEPAYYVGVYTLLVYIPAHWVEMVDPGQQWIYLRLMHDIPSYAGVAIGDRVQLVETGAQADYEIGKDGGLRALR